VRDFLHVEDVARAYVLLVEHGTPGEIFNVCSAVGVTVGDVAREVLRAVGTNADLPVDESLRRPVDLPVLVGRHLRLRAETGWEPRRTRADIIADLIHAASH